jgi:hypothetical protein
MYASKLWHWDDWSECITLVYDASRPRYQCNNGTGEWNTSVAKMSISECFTDGETRLYCSFTRFGAHTTPDGDSNIDCSDWGYANGEILLSGSSDGGQTWSQAINLTNTVSDGCERGDCESEHWSSMAKYSSDSVHIMYVEDRHAGAHAYGYEGLSTENPIKYITHHCFAIEPYCMLDISPGEVDYPTFIAPEGSTGCTGGNTTSFSVTITNTGNLPTDYSADVVYEDGYGWLTPDYLSGDIGVGCYATEEIEYTIGPISAEGVYGARIELTACDGSFVDTIPVRVFVYCDFYAPERYIHSTACWSVSVWNTARSGSAQWDDPEGNMYWYPYWPEFPNGVPFMYDGSVIITYAQDTCKTWFSAFDGSRDESCLYAQSNLTFDTGGDDYGHAHGLWSNGDTSVTGEIDYYIPFHPDTCVLIERIEICNNEDTTVAIHIGEAIDWDIPDDTGTVNNACGIDESRQMVYQTGVGAPNYHYCGGVSFCESIAGATVLDNATWIYPNLGYRPCELGGLLARHTGLEAETPDSLQDMNSVYVVDRNAVLEPDSCVAYCMVKASSMTGLADLQHLIDKGKQWIFNHGLECYRVCDCMPGDATGSGDYDIDDVVRLIGYIFSQGPEPTPYPICSGDANCSCGVDIDDVVYLIAFIFSEGPFPCTCEEWVAACGRPLRE